MQTGTRAPALLQLLRVSCCWAYLHRPHSQHGEGGGGLAGREKLGVYPREVDSLLREVDSLLREVDSLLGR